MSISSMSKMQQSFDSAHWTLNPGEAITLTIGPGQRWVHVTQGRAWITQGANGADEWLERGDRLWVADGAALVMEAWPSAQFELLVPPQACVMRATATALIHRLARHIAQSMSGIWPRTVKSSHEQQRLATPASHAPAIG
jgi:Protein of unknown function (DUF2917)